MKKIISLLVILLFMACQGTQGPQGLDGFNGEDGGLIVASGFEIALDFTIENDFFEIEPYGFDLFPFDVTLVYILWDTTDDGQDVWRLLPQNVTFNDNSTLVYNYDFTLNDVSFFLDGTTDFTTLDPEFTQNQIFRVVVVPTDNVGRMALDYNNYHAVVKALNIKSFEKR